MSYIRKNLLSDEQLVYSTRKHWVIFSFPSFWTIVGLILLMQKDILILLGYLTLIIALYYWIVAITTYLTSEFAVTNKRVLIKTGFTYRQTWETLLSKVATLEVKQNIIGRLLNYGTLIIQNTGGGKDSFTIINSPLLFRRKVQEQAEKMQVNLPMAATLLKQETWTQVKPIEEEKSLTTNTQPRERL